MEHLYRVCSVPVAACALFALTACGGGGGGSNNINPPPPAATYAISGTVTGLWPPGVVLVNGNQTVTVTTGSSAPAPFTFPTAVPSGSAYSVTTETPPASETCVVTNGSGTVGNANVTNVTVTCGYMLGGPITGLVNNGLVLVNNNTDKASPAGGATSFTFPLPVAPDSPFSVTIGAQPSGQLCGVGGGVTVNGTSYLMPEQNDNNIVVPCAQENAASGSWILQSTYAGNAGVYGTLGVPAAGNQPGARVAAATWVDASGALWLFGGTMSGADSPGGLNDLWKYDPGTQLWTWMGGSTAQNASGVYGTRGTAAVANIPGGRNSSSTWVDAFGKLWLFGGDGYDSAGSGGNLNDLWEYDPSTAQWTWMSGSATVSGFGDAGVYGTQGTAAPTNMPGGREDAASWIDAADNLWLFGGWGIDATPNGSGGQLNDLWKYTPGTGQWTWMSGSSTQNHWGVYGAQGTAATGNTPGARQSAATWLDSSGNFWMFGGAGLDSTVDDIIAGVLNDLWEYSPATGLWTWVNGSNMKDQVGVYGTQGVAAALNIPGGRGSAASWIDPSGDLWLFGGSGIDSTMPGFRGPSGSPLAYVGLADVWKFDPTTGQWTWVNGFSRGNTATVSQGVGAPGVPGSGGGMYWADKTGAIWLLNGIIVANSTMYLWKYTNTGN
jgi:N-acetylneuraminic acid mutarotase